jgi:PAS domain S-box-containing protein
MSAEYRILHVDDEPNFASTTAAYLERESDWFHIETAMSADDGLAILDQGEFDCTVSDYDMPGTNGIDFLEAVRDDYPDLPFILFTGKGTEEIASQAISAGVTDYLQKEGGSDQYTLLANRIENAVEKYRAEQELDITRRQYEKVTEQNLAGIYLIQDGEFVYVNPRLADIHGYNREEIMGMSPLDLIAPEERDRVQRNLERRFEGEIGDVHYETVGLTKDGERIDIELHGSRIIYDGKPAVIGTELDITERKENERVVKQAKQRLELALREAQAGIWEWNRETDELYWSNELLEVVGVDEKFDGTFDTFEERLHPDDVDRVETAIESAIDTGERYQVEQRIETNAGGYIWLDVRGQVVEDSSSMVGIAFDITDRKKQEQQLHRQRNRLDDFVSVVSHDLRNPLNVANSRLELAMDDCESPHLDGVEGALERMEALIEDLLELARQGHPIGEIETVALARAGRASREAVETENASISLETDLSIRADKGRLQQLLENLLRNAVEHGSDDVTVTIGALDDGFYVGDTGPGIAPENREEIFDAGYSTTDDGTGFGLSIVEQVVEAHEWDIRVTESADGGARFEITDVDIVD